MHFTLKNVQNHRRKFLRWCAALSIVGCVGGASYEWSFESGLQRLHEAASHRLDMQMGALAAELSRFEYLPGLLQMAPEVTALLNTPSDPNLRDSVNRYLRGVGEITGANMVYILTPGGLSVAASDWDQPGSTIGRNLSFRPYVRDALRTGKGYFYGMGVTSRKPGYYLSYALRQDARLRGVVAVKVNIEQIENTWRRLPGGLLVLDEHGVVILGTRSEWKYRPIEPLNALMRADVAQTRQYGEALLQGLDWRTVRKVDGGAQLIALQEHVYLASDRSMQLPPWHMIVLDDLDSVYALAFLVAITAGLATLALLLAVVALSQRRRAYRQTLAGRAALQTAHDTLEHTVVARTAELRAAQNDLVQAGKMATLGQVSMGVVHELNQPLTAIRTLTDSAQILLEQERAIEVRSNLHRIIGLVDRLTRLTLQLKTFAHRNELQIGSVLLERCLEEAYFISSKVLQQNGVTLSLDVQPAQLRVLAEEDALGRVLVNLFLNSAQAMEHTSDRALQVRARAAQGRVRIEVCDGGPGIRADILVRLFEPFVSSKPSGVGLGLGLLISAQLVHAMGGTIEASNQVLGGACFVLELPQAPVLPPIEE